jgi:flagellin-like hook-associated protein FlgL
MVSITTIGGMALGQAGLRREIDRLGMQVTTGQRATAHGGLGAPEARQAISLRGEVGRREAYAAAADRALARAGTTQAALGRLHDIAKSMTAETARAVTLGASGVEALARSARAALAEVGALLNTRHGEAYVFAGIDHGTAPVPDGTALAGGAMATRIAAAVATLTPDNAAAVLAETGAAATQDTPFAARLEDPATGRAEAPPALAIADGEVVAFGVLANRQADGEVDASWGRELLRGLATLAALSPAVAAQGDGYGVLLEGARSALAGATSGIGAEQGALGAAEARIGAARERHRDTLVALRGQVQAIEEVDLAETVAALRATQSRLEASYEATAMISRLSLAQLLR